MPNPTSLEEAIRHSGEGWLIDSFAPPEEAIPYLRQTLQAVRAIGQQRFEGNAPDLSEKAVVQEYIRNPLRVRGFLQSLGGTRSTEMLLMVWRILQGMEVKDIQLSYRKREQFEVRVVLESAYGEEDPPYVSNNIHDFVLFRHIGILESGGPIFDGFYALRVREA
ncbi:MAG: hypothetical protein HQ581_07715 [Planctomycetes bacterium]|nr:hypothetical protein [Planctomycetota bacterium]